MAGISDIVTAAQNGISAVNSLTQYLTNLKVGANKFFGGPASGSAARPTFRTLTISDITNYTVPANEVLAGPTTGSAADPTFRTLTQTDISQFTVSANQVFAGPTSGSSGDPTFRALVAADIPATTVTLSVLANSISSDILLNNTSSYFTGPIVNQGSSGTWFASGTVTILDTGGSALFDAKLWDGTTVIDSASTTSGGTNFKATISLSGALASPSSSLRISVRDETNTTGVLKANQSGNSKDSTLTVIRIG